VPAKKEEKEFQWYNGRKKGTGGKKSGIQQYVEQAAAVIDKAVAEVVPY